VPPAYHTFTAEDASRRAHDLSSSHYHSTGIIWVILAPVVSDTTARSALYHVVE
jgi:hypothetical protein